MHCPFCSFRNSRVLESRLTEENSSVRRRRECESCQKRFTTYERIESVQILIIKSSGIREPYTREKLHNGVTRACAKTSVTADQIDDLIDCVEAELHALVKREVQSSQLGSMILAKLKTLNTVAYVRFASVYRQFQSVEDFVKELGRIAESNKPAAAESCKTEASFAPPASAQSIN